MIDKNEALDIVSWKDGSIEQISKMLDAHYNGDINISDYWKIGDSRLENINRIPSGTVREEQPDQVIELVIIGMNHDNLATPIGDMSKAAITVQTLNCLNTKGYINSSYFGVDNALWSTSQRRTWCNNEFINALSTLKSLVKPVVKLSNRHSFYAGSYKQQETTEDYAFLLSDWEVWGSQQIDSSAGTLPADGTQYEYMKTASNRIKSINGSTGEWWSRSSFVSHNGYAYFAYVYTDGSCDYNDADYSYGLAPAFCL